MAVTVANDLSTLNGLFKTVYADKLIDLIPDFAVLQKRVEFSGSDKATGDHYEQPVNLANEGGFTYTGSTPILTSLNAAVAGQMGQAQVKGSEMILRSQMLYIALARASSAGPRAFKKASAWKVEDMNNSIRKRLEIAMLYGQTGVGQVLSNVSGVLTLTAASWAGGIWAGSEGHVLEAWSGLTGADTRHDGDLVITAIDSDARTVTVTGSANTNVVANDYLFFKGARTGSVYNEMAGLKKIISNTGSLFNISAANYSLWKGTTYAVGGAVSHAKIQAAVGKAVSKGLMEKVTVLLSPSSWSTLNTDQSALRVFDKSFSTSKGENGFESLAFHSTNGVCEIVSHPMVKDGDGFVVPEESLLRIGSTDVAFGVPGMSEQFFSLVPGMNAVELQCMADQAIFVERPAHCVYLSGIS